MVHLSSTFTKCPYESIFFFPDLEILFLYSGYDSLVLDTMTVMPLMASLTEVLLLRQIRHSLPLQLVLLCDL